MPESSSAAPVTHVASIPPEPFSQLMPGDIVEEGDIYMDPAGTWSEVPRTELGRKVPDNAQAYARLMAPEGYRILAGHSRIKIRDVAWRTREPRWQTVIKDGNDFDVTTVDNLDALYPNESVYVARPDTETPDHVSIPILPHHREMTVGESVRRGDRMICAGMDIWETISERLRGSEVREPAASSKFARYCRPISPQAGHWYVDLREGHGQDAVEDVTDEIITALGGIGSASNPFASLEVARRIIEAAAKKAGQPVFGVIWDVSGVPLFAYDLPEPPPTSPTREQMQMNVPVPGLVVSPAEPCEPVEQAVRPVTRSERDLKALDQIDMEKFYVLSPEDWIEEGDMIYGSVDVSGDVWAWQKVAGHLHLDNHTVSSDRLMVRRRAPTKHLDLLKLLADELVTDAKQTLAKVKQLRRSLDEEH